MLQEWCETSFFSQWKVVSIISTGADTNSNLLTAGEKKEQKRIKDVYIIDLLTTGEKIAQSYE